MNRIALLLFMILFCTDNCLSQNVSQSQESLPQLISVELLEVNAHFATATKIRFVNEPHVSTIHDTIFVGLGWLEETLKPYQYGDWKYILRLLFAHEVVHSIQFKRNLVNLSSISAKRLLEAQADILASKFLLESIQHYFVSSAVDSTNPEYFRIVNIAANFLVGLGDGVYDESDHPYRLQRRMSFRIGEDAARLTRLRNLLKTMRSSMTQAEQIDLKKSIQRAEINCIFYSLDDFAWSLKMAKMVVHYDTRLARTILIGWEINSVDTIKGKPYLYYRYVIANLGKDTILFQFQSRIESVNKNSANNVFFSRPINSRYYTLKIAPGKQKDLSDSLETVDEFGNFDSDKKLKFVYLGQSSSLFSVERLHTHAKKPLEKEVKKLSFSNASTVKYYVNVVIDLIERLKSEDFSFKDLISDVGTQLLTENSLLRSTIYPLISPFSQITLSTSSVLNPLPKVISTLGNFSPEKANIKYDSLITEIKQIYDDEIIKEKRFNFNLIAKDDTSLTNSSFLINGLRYKLLITVSVNKSYLDGYKSVIIDAEYLDNKNEKDLFAGIKYIISIMPSNFEAIIADKKQLGTNKILRTSYYLPDAIHANIFDENSSSSYSTTLLRTNDSITEHKLVDEINVHLTSLLPDWNHKQYDKQDWIGGRWTTKDKMQSILLMGMLSQGYYQVSLEFFNNKTIVK